MFEVRIADLRLSEHQLKSVATLEQLLEGLGTAMPRLVAPTASAERAELVPQADHELHVAFSEAPVATLSALKAGLWLLADELTKSHEICQDIHTPFGSAWHAMMHRREGDFPNSCYWWRRASAIEWVAVHDGDDLAGHILTALHKRWPGDAAPGPVAAFAEELEEGEYDPATFVGLVEAASNHPDPMQSFLLEVQRMEWLHLFGQCLDAARQNR